MTSCPVLGVSHIRQDKPSASCVGSFDLDAFLQDDRVAIMVSPFLRRCRDEDGDFSSKNPRAQEPPDYRG